MNKYDERYDIRLAKISDISRIMEFIDLYWRKNHIMSKDRKLFEYEYVEDYNVNFVIAIEKNTDKIEGIFGFINCSKNIEKKDIWGSMWMVNEFGNNMPLLGVELAKRALLLSNSRMHIGNGANPNTTIPIRRLFFNEKVGKMDHYYYLNNDIENYKIAIVEKKRKECKEKKVLDMQLDIIEFSCIEDLKLNFDIEKLDTIPYKDNWYINKRYFKHPYYKYNLYGLKIKNQEVNAVIITREVTYQNSKVLRIVDYIGNHELFSQIGSWIEYMLKKNKYEYVDFYSYGFDRNLVLKAGFEYRNQNDTNIIPNYFEPLLKENVDIWVHYKLEGTTFFKADGDQDRPNLLK